MFRRLDLSNLLDIFFFFFFHKKRGIKKREEDFSKAFSPSQNIEP